MLSSDAFASELDELEASARATRERRMERRMKQEMEAALGTTQANGIDVELTVIDSGAPVIDLELAEKNVSATAKRRRIDMDDDCHNFATASKITMPQPSWLAIFDEEESSDAACAPTVAAAGHTWSTEGQCEGITRAGERCKVHTSSPYAIAEPLRRGERFCGHHRKQG